MTKYVDYGEGNYKSDRQLSSTSYRDTRRTNSSSSETGHFGGFRVYVGDIGQRIGRTDLEREFGQYGPVTDVWMGRKREPTSQNYAFVVYRYPEDADEAVRDRNGRKVCGRQVRVEHAKPVNSNPRRHRGSWDYRGRGDYNSSRGGGQQRRRSRERYNSNRRCVLMHDSFSDSSPKKSRKRSASSSPDPKLKYVLFFGHINLIFFLYPRKSKKSKKEISVTPSPSRQNQQIQDSDSGSLSSTPPPKKKKKKPKQRGHSSSQSPQASDEYDARQYQKSQDGRGDGRKIRPAKNKNKTNYDGNDGYSSDDN
ncbi:unnamed protein product [Lymnaea stagnalis]|uniref:RRM domain-containing protein n=1 Tax=Lymnaea stagnalis TaxID=6523 RepID=A0AAV2GY06_LYMST